MKRIAMNALFAVLCLASALAFAQQGAPQAPSAGPHDMKTMPHDMSNTSAQTDPGAAPAESGVMHSMEGRHMDMGPHMKMTALRPIEPGDAERAQKVVIAARAVMEKYKDYHTALNDGFQIFHPEIPQKQYHFTNYSNAFAAFSHFDPDNPTSLLYEKDGDTYRLVGVMYTAPKRYTEDDLNQRIPLSIAQWHEHVNYCAPPAGHKAEVLVPNPKFGLHGSITTQAECDAAGGEFHPVIFNWMVHVYPLEKDDSQIWSVDRQHQHQD
ncbi:MAG: hypothetical protein WBQ72_19685 [Terriglobales bacterium]|jgi:hypothetical protein